jgi:hypothetical protein
MGLKEEIDRQVGLDTEQARVNFLKYVNLGRQIAGEEGGLLTMEQAEQMVRDRSKAILDEVDSLLGAISQKQAEVEKVEEDEAFTALVVKNTGPDGSVPQVVSDFEEILNAVDERHTSLLAERAKGLADIRAKFA